MCVVKNFAYKFGCIRRHSCSVHFRPVELRAHTVRLSGWGASVFVTLLAEVRAFPLHFYKMAAAALKKQKIQHQTQDNVSPGPTQPPSWLPNPLQATECVDVVHIAERLRVVAQAAFGTKFAERAPLAIGKNGWSAPFDQKAGKTALRQTEAYQCGMNLCAMKLSDACTSINWRNDV